MKPEYKSFKDVINLLKKGHNLVSFTGKMNVRRYQYYYITNDAETHYVHVNTINKLIKAGVIGMNEKGVINLL